MGNTLALAGQAAPAVKTSLNFAYGGATAGAGSAVPSLGQQITLFQQRAITPGKDDLFTVLAGANDLLGTLASPTISQNPGAVGPAGAAAAQQVANGVQSLLNLGAKNLVVLNLPNLGATPRLGASSTTAALGFSATSAFNTELRARLGTVAAKLPTDANLVLFDVEGVLGQVIGQYRALGFTNITQDFLSVQPSGVSTASANVDQFVFFDSIHPTAHTHALLAASILEALNPAPVVATTAALGNVGLVDQALSDRLVTDRLATVLAPQVRGAGVFAAYQYAHGTQRHIDLLPGLEYEGGVFGAGADFALGKDWRAGLAVTSGELKTKLAGGAGRFDLASRTVRAYAGTRLGAWSLGVDGSYGFQDYRHIQRRTALGGLMTEGQADADLYGLGVQARFDTKLGTVAMTPFAGLRYQRIALDPYVERNIAALAMAYEAQQIDATTGHLGVDFTQAFPLGSRASTLGARVEYAVRFEEADRLVGGRLADNFTRSTYVNAREPDSDTLEVAAQWTVALSASWHAELSYGAQLLHGSIDQRGGVVLRSAF